MSLRILHVLDHSIPLHSGYTFRTRSIIREQRRLGWHTEHLTSPKHAVAGELVEEVDGLRFHRTPASSASRRAGVLAQLAVIRDTRRRLEEIIPQLKPDVLHAHSPSLNGIAALWAARRFGLPVVYEIRAFWEDAAVDHGTTTQGSLRYRISKVIETWLLRRVDAVTVICHGLRDDLLQRGIPASRITVIPNAVDVEKFPVIATRDLALRRELGLDDAMVLGFLGSFYGYEGLDILLDAMPEILRKQPRVRVLLVGGGYEEARLKAQAQQLGIADKVIFTGRVPHADINRYYSLVDLLVYPRKSMRLTNTVTPLKPLEAMAQGIVLAASDVGGHRELIRDGETGYLFRPDDPTDLARCVTRILADSRAWEAVRSAGRNFVESERTWKNSVACYRPVYSGLLGRGVRMNILPSVLIVGPLPPPAGGMANQTAQLQQLLAREGLLVEVVNTQAAVRPAWISRLFIIRALFRLVPYLARLWRACGRADIVHIMANSGWSWHLFAAPAIRIARMRGRPVVVNYRGGLAREFLARSAPGVLGALHRTQLVVPSRFLQEVFGEFGREAKVVPNVVDLTVFHPGDGLRAREGFRIVVARNLEHLYGIDLALRALALIRDEIPEARLAIAGSGPDRTQLEALARQLGIEDQVEFTGPLTPSQIAERLRCAAVALNPVRADNMPNSVLEALACGAPVLSTRVGGVPFLVEHGRSAWLVDPESAAAIAEGLRRLRHDSSLCERLASGGREIAESCAWQAVRERWLTIYREAKQGA